jgi:hypothetical protein
MNLFFFSGLVEELKRENSFWRKFTEEFFYESYENLKLSASYLPIKNNPV